MAALLYGLHSMSLATMSPKGIRVFRSDRLARGKEIKAQDENKNKNLLPLSSGILLTDSDATFNLIHNFKQPDHI
jgi:hypothetical protein